MTRSLAALVSLVIVTLSGCATYSPSTRMRVAPQQPPAADTGNATVVFLMPSDRVIANAVLDETGRALGEVPAKSLLVATVTPGVHTFIKAMYKNPGKGDFSLWGHDVCSQVWGTFEAGKIYFVEMSVFRPFMVKPGDGRLATWAAAPRAELDASQGPASVASDPEWKACVAEAAKSMEHDRKKSDDRSVVGSEDGVTSWPQ